MKRIVFVVISLFLLFTTQFFGFGQEILTAEHYFETVSEKYGNVQDYIADITMKMEKSEMQGILYFKTPNKLRIDFQEPVDQVLVTDGEELTVYIPEYRVVMSQVLKKQSEAAMATLASSEGLDLLKRNYDISFLNSPDLVPLDSEEDILEGGSDELVVKLNADWRNTDEGFRQLEIAINPEGFIRRITGVTVGYQQVQLDFLNIRINQNIPDGRFEYDPPASANVYNNFLFEPEN